MNIRLLFCLAAVTLALGASAQQPGAESVTVSAPRIVVPAKAYPMTRAKFIEEFWGAYDLSNGQTLHLTHNGWDMYAEIGNEGPRRIVAADANTFVALDGKLKIHLEVGVNGYASGEVVMVRPVQNTASGYPSEQVVALATR